MAAQANRAEEQTRIDGEHDRRYDNNGQGQVKDPEHDGRLKENREQGVSMQDMKDDSSNRSSGDNRSSNNRSSKDDDNETEAQMRDRIRKEAKDNDNRSSGKQESKADMEKRIREEEGVD